MTFEIMFVLLFGIATAVAMVARRLDIPYTVALVVAGLVLGLMDSLDAPHLTQELLYAVFLPGLLFEAAFHLEFRKFWKNKVAVASLAIPGLLTAILLTSAILTPVAAALGFVEGFEFIHGLVFASLIAATDPIAVVGLFKSLGAPKRLAILVEGESLINDGTAVVVFTLVLSVAMGAELTAGTAIARFLVVAGAGAFVGLLFGYAVSWLTHQIEDPMVEITLTTIAAYGAFAVAEHFHVSGVIATVVAGMLCGNYGARTGMSPSTKIAVLSFWEYWAFALNSFVFLLIGLEVDMSAMLASWQPILAAFLAVMAARTIVVYIVTFLLQKSRERIPWPWAAVLTWGGLRGSLSMVLVLALPIDFPHRQLLITMTFGVVVLSILCQGLSIGRLMSWLGITGGESNEEYERYRSELATTAAALEELDIMRRGTAYAGESLDTLQASYQARMKAARQGLRSLHLETAELREQEYLAAARHLLLIEKDALQESLRSGAIGQEAYELQLGALDARILQVESGDVASAFSTPSLRVGSEDDGA